MEVEDLALDGLKLIRPRLIRDHRGFLLEAYHAERYALAGITTSFVQDNVSHSVRGTVRGLHYQLGPGQAKLVQAVAGRVFDVAVDIRPSSPTFGKWQGVVLDGEQQNQLFVPVGFAHGLCVLSERATVLYRMSRYYRAEAERGFRWDDPEVGVDWPIGDPVLSDRDREAEPFAALRRRLQR